MARPPDYDVAVLGAGIVGASAAWHLARRGMRVVVIDASGPAAAASGASDGAVSVASKKPGVMARLANRSLAYTRRLAEAGGPLRGVFGDRPSYYLATSPAEEQALGDLVAKIAALGGPARVTADGAKAGPDGVGPSVTRCVALAGEGHMLGYAAVAAYLAQAGVDRLWPVTVEALEADDAGVTVSLTDRNLRVAKVVAALGTSSTALFPGLPVTPRTGQLVVTDRAPPGSLPGPLTAASYLVAKSASPGAPDKPPVVIDPLSTGQFLIGSSREEHGNRARTDFATVRRLAARAAEFWPALRARHVVRIFAGVRAAVSDGLPIVGPLAQSPRIVLATGFEGDGICLSGLMGREVAAMVAGEAASAGAEADIAALSPARFSRREARVR